MSHQQGQKDKTMFLPEKNLLVHQEQHKDRLREMEHRQLLREAGLEPDLALKAPRQAARWLGTQMVIWGTKLQEVDTPTPSANATGKI
jgi:hypothetical protein